MQRSRLLDIRFVAGLILAAVLLGWFFARLSWGELWQALLDASLPWVGISALVMLGEWLLRPIRWYVLIGPVDATIRLRDLWSATLAGAAFNTIVPLRGGDIVRPAIVARRSGVPFTTVLLTTVVERLFDILGVLAVVLAMLLALPSQALQSEIVVNLRTWGLFFGAVGLSLLGLAALLGTGRTRFLLGIMLVPLPSRLHGRAVDLFDKGVSGLAVVGDPRRLLLALLITLALWANGLLAILTIFQAFGLQLPVAAGLFVEAALALSVALPQAPGFLGVFQIIIEETTSMWGASEGVAEALALVFWGVSFLPVTALGLGAAWREGLGLLSSPEALLPEPDLGSPPSEAP